MKKSKTKKLSFEALVKVLDNPFSIGEIEKRIENIREEGNKEKLRLIERSMVMDTITMRDLELEEILGNDLGAWNMYTRSGKQYLSQMLYFPSTNLREIKNRQGCIKELKRRGKLRGKLKKLFGKIGGAYPVEGSYLDYIFNKYGASEESFKETKEYLLTIKEVYETLKKVRNKGTELKKITGLFSAIDKNKKFRDVVDMISAKKHVAVYDLDRDKAEYYVSHQGIGKGIKIAMKPFINEDVNRDLINMIKEKVEPCSHMFKKIYRAVGRLEAFVHHADSSKRKNDKTPKVFDNDFHVINVINGHHPLLLKDPDLDEEEKGIVSVPNNIHVDGKNHGSVITGPNYSGKTTYSREVGILQAKAQASFDLTVESAEMSIADHILTHSVLTDDIVNELSRFGNKMHRINTIFSMITPRSVVIFDEPCDDTDKESEIKEGDVILRKAIEIGATVLYLTHNKELAFLVKGNKKSIYSKITNFAMSATKLPNGEIEYHHKLLVDAIGESYGEEVSEKMGLSEKKIMQKIRKRKIHFRNTNNRSVDENKFDYIVKKLSFPTNVNGMFDCYDLKNVHKKFVVDKTTMEDLELEKILDIALKRKEMNLITGRNILTQQVLFPLSDLESIKERQEAYAEIYSDDGFRKNINDLVEELSKYEIQFNAFLSGQEKVKYSENEKEKWDNIFDLFTKSKEYMTGLFKLYDVIKDAKSKRLQEIAKEFKNIFENKRIKKVIDIMFSENYGHILNLNDNKFGEMAVAGRMGKLFINKGILKLDNPPGHVMDKKAFIGVIRNNCFGDSYEKGKYKIRNMGHFRRLMNYAGKLEMYAHLANLAKETGRMRLPDEVTDSGKVRIDIKGGIHPLIDAGKVVPIDIYADDEKYVYDTTGPNEDGKTTSKKMASVNKILAQAGFPVFITKEGYAKIKISDKICSHFAGRDSVKKGISGYTAKQERTNKILEYVTPESFVIFDEPEGNTSDEHGTKQTLLLIRAMQELGATAFFTTHLYNVAKEIEKNPQIYHSVGNLQVLVEENINGTIAKYLYLLKPGIASKSYGEDVARRLGVDEKGINKIIRKRLKSRDLIAIGR